MEGIPLSCRLTYIQSINNQSVKPSDDFYVELQNRYTDELVRIIDAYISAGWNEEGLNLLKLGSPAWQQNKISYLYATKGQLKQALQLFESAPLQGSSEQRLEDLIGLYLAAGDPAHALEKVNSIRSELTDYRRAVLLVRISALFAKNDQKLESEKVLSQALQSMKSLSKSSSKDTSNFLSIAVGSYAELGQAEQALKVADQLGNRQVEKAKEQEGFALLDVVHSYLAQGRHNQALEILLRVEQININLLEQQHELDRLLPKGRSIPSHFVFSSVLAESTILAYAEVGEFKKAIELTNIYSRGSQIWQVDKQIKVARRAWVANKKELAKEFLFQAQKTSESIDKNFSNITKLYVLIDLAETEHMFGQAAEAKELVDHAANIAKALPNSNLEERFSKTKAFNRILRNYTALDDYDRALSIAQAEADPQERDRLIKLVQCATR